MPMTSHLPKLLAHFRKNTHGGIALMGGLMITVIATSVIAAVDITDMTVTKQKMQDRVDSAVLYAILQDKYRDPKLADELQTVARKYILDSVRTTGVNAENITTDFIYDADRDRIVGDVKFSPPAIFVGSLFAPYGMAVSAEAAPQVPTKVELALVLDVSGSMNWGIASDTAAPAGSRRIDALRAGVTSLVTTLDETPRVDLKMSVIPYSTSVDVGGLLATAGGSANTYFQTKDGSPLPQTCEKKRGYARCMIKNFLQALFGGGNTAKDPSPPGAWGVERYVAKNGNNFTLDVAKPLGSGRVSVITQPTRTTKCDDSYVEAYGERCLEFVDIDGTLYAEKDYFAPRSGVMGLTKEADDLLAFMNALEAEGGTAGHIGAAWGLYSLSEDWDDVFKHEDGKPAKFDSETKKIMVIMTDGDFTMTHDDNMTIAETYDYFQAVCSLARSKGVEVYTVGLRTSAQTDTQLTACAGAADHYFSADSRAQLLKAFEKIAENASRVRLSS